MDLGRQRKLDRMQRGEEVGKITKSRDPRRPRHPPPTRAHR